MAQDEPLAADEKEMLIASDDEEEIRVIAATSIFMRRDLRTFALIVSAHPYCERKFTSRHG